MKKDKEIEKTIIDYKNVEVLYDFVNPNGRIMSRKRTNTLSKDQKQISQAIKRARFMGLMPYVAR